MAQMGAVVARAWQAKGCGWATLIERFANQEIDNATSSTLTRLKYVLTTWRPNPGVQRTASLRSAAADVESLGG